MMSALSKFKAKQCLIALSLCATPAGAGEMWVSNEKDDTVSVIDVDTLEVVRTVSTGERPRGIIFSKDHDVLYICASDSDTVQVMDPDTGKVLHNLPSGEDPEQFALHPNNRFLYIANEDDAISTVVDTETRKVIAQINVGIEPEGMAEHGALDRHGLARNFCEHVGRSTSTSCRVHFGWGALVGFF